MFKKILENRIIILYLLPLFLGLLTVLSFQPYNLSYINFIIFPIFFNILFYKKKNLQMFIEKNLLKDIYFSSDLYLALAFI